jgi:hypothetical protein
MRSSPGFSDKSVRPSFLRTTAVKKPRTEWGCQPVAFMIVAIVVPWGSLSKASTASCLVPLPVEAEGMRRSIRYEVNASPYSLLLWNYGRRWSTYLLWGGLGAAGGTSKRIEEIDQVLLVLH